MLGTLWLGDLDVDTFEMMQAGHGVLGGHHGFMVEVSGWAGAA